MIEKSDITILLLDDDAFMLKLLGAALRGLGFTRVTACNSGPTALACIDSEGGVPDMILSDLNMPGMDGVEFVRHLVERRYAGSLILVSGEDERNLQAAAALVSSHRIKLLGPLRKPVTRQALAGLLDTWVPQRAGRPTVAKCAYPAAEVRLAIGRGELMLHYQPKVVVATGEVTGVEALVRWRHPVDGLVFPDHFIGVAEEHGLIQDLTAVVLRLALAQARQWRDAGLALRMSVNVSMHSLAELSFPQFVAEQAAAAGVMPEAVLLEVSHGRLMKDLGTVLEALARLRLMGFSVSIDDCGHDHAWLAPLRHVSFDEIKIDRGFVHGAGSDATLRATFNATLSLALSLGLDSVAEGVEDEDDWHFLRRTPCDMAQGDFIARPMPAQALPAWMQAWQARMADELQAAG